MKLTEEDFDAIIHALDLLYRPAEYGCRFDFGDPATHHERAGRIIENLSATAAAMLFLSKMRGSDEVVVMLLIGMSIFHPTFCGQTHVPDGFVGAQSSRG